MLFTNFDFQDYLEIIQHSDFQDENKTIRNNIFTIASSSSKGNYEALNFCYCLKAH
jgi:hypothetical protein